MNTPEERLVDQFGRLDVGREFGWGQVYDDVGALTSWIPISQR
jgi:hypothetical protein